MSNPVAATWETAEETVVVLHPTCIYIRCHARCAIYGTVPDVCLHCVIEILRDQHPTWRARQVDLTIQGYLQQLPPPPPMGGLGETLHQEIGGELQRDMMINE